MIWAQVLIIAWILTRIGLRSRLLVILIAMLAMVPFCEGVSAAMALRGLWGDPGITSLQLMTLGLLGKIPSSLRSGWRIPMLIVLVALALYGSALGPWDIDLYRLGYQPATLVAVLGAACLIAWWRGEPLYLWMLTIDLWAWHAGWLESSNLWDYLLDPLFALVMTFLALRNVRKRRSIDTISIA